MWWTCDEKGGARGGVRYSPAARALCPTQPPWGQPCPLRRREVPGTAGRQLPQRHAGASSSPGAAGGGGGRGKRVALRLIKARDVRIGTRLQCSFLLPRPPACPPLVCSGVPIPHFSRVRLHWRPRCAWRDDLVGRPYPTFIGFKTCPSCNWAHARAPGGPSRPHGSGAGSRPRATRRGSAHQKAAAAWQSRARWGRR